MIEIPVPGCELFRFEHLVLDYNGTLACDGALLPGAAARLSELAGQLQVHVLTADTFGGAREALLGLPCQLSVIARDEQSEAKQRFVKQLAPAHTVAIGNGRNDALMMRAATLGIAIVGPEGAATETLVAAKIAAPDICAALDLLTNPLRLVATLRR